MNFSNTLEKACHYLTDGWTYLTSKAGSALTYFEPKSKSDLISETTEIGSRWGLLTTNLQETDKVILLNIEVPGMEKNDLNITVDSQMLTIEGEKLLSREDKTDCYLLMECAYGRFQRTIPLPHKVIADSGTASYKNGVLKIELCKAQTANRQENRIRIS